MMPHDVTVPVDKLNDKEWSAVQEEYQEDGQDEQQLEWTWIGFAAWNEVRVTISVAAI